ncbi:hypothetical protein ACR30L_16130 [Psychromonas sp. PT13]|uniref:hypothetical protein n=1 Tax=Psychromonas sp. PT13 TaxID=3439547 RepID=UPI003EBA5ACB
MKEDMPIEPIVLSAEQKRLPPCHKRQLYYDCYITIIERMKEKNVKFPAGANELGIDVTIFATKWVGLPDRGPLYKNKLINARLAKDIKELGIESVQARSITEDKQSHDLMIQRKEVNDLQKQLLSLSNQLDIAQESLYKKETENSLLRAKLKQKDIHFEQELNSHKLQFENCLTEGGRTF